MIAEWIKKYGLTTFIIGIAITIGTFYINHYIDEKIEADERQRLMVELKELKCSIDNFNADIQDHKDEMQELKEEMMRLKYMQMGKSEREYERDRDERRYKEFLRRMEEKSIEKRETDTIHINR